MVAPVARVVAAGRVCRHFFVAGAIHHGQRRLHDSRLGHVIVRQLKVVAVLKWLLLQIWQNLNGPVGKLLHQPSDSKLCPADRSCGLLQLSTPNAIFFRLSMHWVRRTASRAACTAGNSRATKMPMMAITTKSSTSVKPRACARIQVPTDTDMGIKNGGRQQPSLSKRYLAELPDVYVEADDDLQNTAIP